MVEANVYTASNVRALVSRVYVRGGSAKFPWIITVTTLASLSVKPLSSVLWCECAVKC